MASGPVSLKHVSESERPQACRCPRGTIPDKFLGPGSLTNERQHSAQRSALGRTLKMTSRQFQELAAESSRNVASTGTIAGADDSSQCCCAALGWVVALLNHMAQYLFGPILTRSQCYDVSTLRQRQALVQTFHMTLNSISDATYFPGNGQHMHAASMTRYFMWPIPTRSQCYDVSALHQRQAQLKTFHKTPISVSDALYFSGYR